MAKPGLRRQGREAAVQLLYSREVEADATQERPEGNVLRMNGTDPLIPAKDLGNTKDFWELCSADHRAQKHAIDLSLGVLRHLDEIDAIIGNASENYSIARLAATDRAIIRIAVYEILHEDEIAAPVSVNEAIEIARRFGSESSSRFVNGILDRIVKELAPS